MVKIITLKKDFNNKEDNLYLKFDFDKSFSLSIIDKDVPHSIKRTKISSLFCGSIKINDIEEELLKFPSGKHDDLIDALAYAVSMLKTHDIIKDSQKKIRFIERQTAHMKRLQSRIEY